MVYAPNFTILCYTFETIPSLYNMWVSVCVCGCFDNCVRVSVIFLLVFTVFCIVCTVLLHCVVYVYLFLFVLSVLV